MEHLNETKEKLDSEYSKLELGQLYGKQLGTYETAAPTLPEQTSDTLKQAFNDYWDEFSHKWKPRSKIDYDGIRKQILELLRPDTQLHTLSYVQLRDIRNGLRSGKLLLRQLNTPHDVIPAKAGIQANTGCRIKSGMTAILFLIAGLISKSGDPLSIDRVNLFVGLIKGVYDLALKKDRNLDRLNPADGLRLQDKRAPSSKQDIFTSEELKNLFCDEN